MVNIIIVRIDAICIGLKLKALLGYFALSAETRDTPVTEEVEEESTSFNARLSRLREKHSQFPEFKLQCWARMLVRKK